MEKPIILKAGYISQVEPSNTPGEPFRQRVHYSNIILDLYGLHDYSCDSSDLACLNEDLMRNRLTFISEIECEKYWGYTHLVQDLDGNKYAISLTTSS